MACSFGGPTGMVLLDMAMKIDSSIEVFYPDTDFLFAETYHLRDVCEQKYGFKPIGYKSLLTVEAQAAQHGPELWTRDPDLCCDLRKVEPNHRALEGKKAWISGMRRDQSKTRANVAIVDWDEKFDLVKLNPLAAWDEKQVWAYIIENGVPYNELHDRGYPSIGCTNCTKPVRPGDDPRSGRWAGFDKEECGIQEGTVEVIHLKGDA
jgi:phosphoadenosine phosphosulfate reductase